jgi:Ca-activated chloride channel family protein
MLRFQHIEYLWALLLVPVVLLLFLGFMRWRRSRMTRLGDERLVQQMFRGYVPGRAVLKFLLLFSALITGILGLANLQMGNRMEKVERKGVDVMIALDVSKSMLATDVQPTRLERSKQLIQRLMDKLGNDRIGLVIFAGKSYLSVPLTVDYSAIKMILSTVGPEMVPTQGTVIGDAIKMSAEAFNEKEQKYKSLIVISDGEDHDETVAEAVKEAVSKGMMISTVGVGSPQGVPLVDASTGEPKLDENGQQVITKLNEPELKEIAASGKGIYQLLNNSDKVADALKEQINSMEQKRFGDVLFTDYNSYFQYFLLLTLVLLVLEFFLPDTKPQNKPGVA